MSALCIFHDNANLGNEKMILFTSSKQLYEFVARYQNAGGFRRFEYDYEKDTPTRKGAVKSSQALWVEVYHALYGEVTK